MLLLCSQIHGNTSRGHKSKTEAVYQAKKSASTLAKQRPSGLTCGQPPAAERVHRQAVAIPGVAWAEQKAGRSIGGGETGRSDLAGQGPDAGQQILRTRGQPLGKKRLCNRHRPTDTSQRTAVMLSGFKGTSSTSSFKEVLNRTLGRALHLRPARVSKRLLVVAEPKAKGQEGSEQQSLSHMDSRGQEK